MIGRGEVTSEGLKVHVSIPDGKVIDELKLHDRVIVLDRASTATAAWLQIITPRDDVGFVAARFVHWNPCPIPDVDPPPPPPRKPIPEERFPTWAALTIAGVVALVVILIVRSL